MNSTKEQVFLCTISECLSNEERRFLSSNFLSGTDLQKFSSIKDLKKSDEYLQSHAFTQFILSRILEIPALSISFYTNAFGKPFISEEINSKQVFFNLAHTCGLTALIIGNNDCIGIDAENIVIPEDISLIEQVVFHEEELAQAKKITDGIERANNFYAKWVIKESILKAVGTGLSLDPKLLLIVEAAKDRFEVRSEILNKASSLYTTYKTFMNRAIAYTTCKGPYTYPDVKTSLYNYSQGTFNQITSYFPHQ